MVVVTSEMPPPAGFSQRIPSQARQVRSMGYDFFEAPHGLIDTIGIEYLCGQGPCIQPDAMCLDGKCHIHTNLSSLVSFAGEGWG